MWDQNKYCEALNYAAAVHGDQKVPGQPYSYVVHLAEVAQEVMAAIADAASKGGSLDADLAVQCALLHDTIEDARVSYGEIKDRFGPAVAEGVAALSKNEALPKEQQMGDSLDRIRRQPKEVWMVKLADRITNLQAPPGYWTDEKKKRYREEAQEILHALGEADAFLAARLKVRIEK